MILFKACPRCGGDVDATYRDDAFCIQCSFRPQMGYPGLVTVADSAGEPVPAPGSPAPSMGGQSGAGGPADAAGQAGSLCPRCDRADLLALEKLRARDNTCYRCRPCGHIFSPAVAGPVPQKRTSMS